YWLVQYGIRLYTDLLWFQHLGFESVYMTRIWARLGAGLLIAVPFAVLFWVNAFLARWLSVRNILFFSEETLMAQKFVGWGIWAAGLVLAWLVGTAASTGWSTFLRFLNRRGFNLTDPIFNMDIGYYVFSLPFYHFIQTWLVIGLFLSLLGVVALYALAQQNNLAEGKIVILPHVQLHLSVLGALIFLAFAAGHYLDLFDLLYSPRGVAFGASYTDIHVELPAQQVMIVIALLVAVVLLVNIYLRRPALSLLAIFVWILAGVIGTGFLPGLVQRYVVEPNELERERPYIEHNIRLTTLAYGLDKIAEKDFADIAPLTPDKLQAEKSVLDNLRLWDYRPLLQTYQQIQAIRLYYRFNDVDFDRYNLDGTLRQIALSARELEKGQLQSATWVTQKLQFTHGYGLVANPVNEVTDDGLPRLWIKDLPPVSPVGLDVTRPEIYYGETTNDYVFVHTNAREFNYPSGDENVYADYEGTGGVMMDSLLKRLAFAARLGDINILLSRDLTDQSRVLLNRNIKERVRTVAPFLRYDNDPYLVISPEGRLFWVQDAYTVSDRFPYSEPIGGLNYIRNSVKVLIDAYNGDLTFFLFDPQDPLIQTYAAIFPALFTPADEMPGWLREHIRYPEDMFQIQARLYQTYHMRNVNVFYNKEDLWQIPMEKFAGNTQPVEPYYVILKLPGEAQAEFLLIQPFTPNNKDNLIAWLAARSDGEHYGKLVAYRFPKQELIYGPLQIEGRIDQDPEISSQITLWDQGGSEVIRGNLLVLPIDNSLMYVEPLYLRAENGQIPELKRVILAAGDRIVMRPNLEEALTALFGGTAPAPTTPVAEAPPAPGESNLLPGTVGELARTAAAHYEAAQEALRRGDWAAYGEELNKMESALKALVRLTEGE
ncbi:MAG: UPF0182 family protein, partial [Chloroflexi bacterium]